MVCVINTNGPNSVRSYTLVLNDRPRRVRYFGILIDRLWPPPLTGKTRPLEAGRGFSSPDAITSKKTRDYVPKSRLTMTALSDLYTRGARGSFDYTGMERQNNYKRSKNRIESPPRAVFKAPWYAFHFADLF